MGALAVGVLLMLSALGLAFRDAWSLMPPLVKLATTGAALAAAGLLGGLASA